MKTCSDCKQEKSENKFYIDRRSKTGRSSKCKECSKRVSKAWYETSEKYRQIIRNSGLKHRFGITADDYYEMLQAQDGCCFICKHKDEKHLHVDHCHETGVVRGLLCKNCNHGLGNFRDNKEFLSNAIEYLDRNSVRK